jgi:hypothetical protein
MRGIEAFSNQIFDDIEISSFNTPLHGTPTLLVAGMEETVHRFWTMSISRRRRGGEDGKQIKRVGNVIWGGEFYLM